MKEKNPKGLIELLGYVQSVNNGTFLLPPLLIFPTFILPLQKQQKYDENDKENTVFLKNGLQEEYLFNKETDEDIETNFRQTLNRGATSTKKIMMEVQKSQLSVRQSNDAPNITDINIETHNSTDNETQTIEETTENNTVETKPVTETSGWYPTANYNNSNIDNLLLTIEIPEQELSLANDDRWQNFTVSTNLILTNDKSNLTTPVNDSTTEESRSTNKGPYSAALYNNAVIDQLSITTNSYTNEESPLPPPKNDRWRTLTSLKKIPSATGFKPLAGLYYDGFLHKPLIMLPGFIPRKYYNLY